MNFPPPLKWKILQPHSKIFLRTKRSPHNLGGGGWDGGGHHEITCKRVAFGMTFIPVKYASLLWKTKNKKHNLVEQIWCFAKQTPSDLQIKKVDFDKLIIFFYVSLRIDSVRKLFALTEAKNAKSSSCYKHRKRLKFKTQGEVISCS